MTGKSEKMEEKKVPVLLGSPRRKCNSAILADRIAKGAKARGSGKEDQ